MKRARLLSLIPALVATLVAAALPLPVAAADRPNQCTGATVSSPTNTWLSDTIGSATDVDWYRFSNATGRYALITLGALPADYDLFLYASSSCANAIASSHRSNRAYDEIYRYLPAGTYYVKVVGFESASGSSPYQLRFRPLAEGAQILSYTASTDSAGYLHVVGEVLNNTGDRRRWVQINASLRDSAGRSLGSGVGYAELGILAPRSRSPFEVIARRPSAYHHSSLSVTSRVTTATPVANLPITASAPYASSGRWHFGGTVRNANASTVNLTQTLVTLYDARGGVAGLGSSWTTPNRLATGARAPFDAHASSSISFNRVTYQSQASRSGCTAGHSTTAGTPQVFDGAIPGAGNRVALTFDMGGRMVPAARIMNSLVANRVCATIFPTGVMTETAEGQQVMAIIRAHPELFEMGNHTMDHCNLRDGGGGSPSTAFCPASGTTPSAAFIRQQLSDAGTIIANSTGQSARPYWRPPYGAYNSTVLNAIDDVGYTKTFMWDVDTIDWKPTSQGGPTATSMTLKVVGNAQAGSDVLMHLGGYETADALHAMIRGLRSRGYVLTTLSDMVER